MKTAAVLIEDVRSRGGGICPLPSSPLRGSWQRKCPHSREFAIQERKNANARGLARGGHGRSWNWPMHKYRIKRSKQASLQQRRLWMWKRGHLVPWKRFKVYPSSRPTLCPCKNLRGLNWCLSIHPSTSEKISISLRPGLGLRSPIVERNYSSQWLRFIRLKFFLQTWPVW